MAGTRQGFMRKIHEAEEASVSLVFAKRMRHCEQQLITAVNPSSSSSLLHTAHASSTALNNPNT